MNLHTEKIFITINVLFYNYNVRKYQESRENRLSKSESVKFLQIESVICFFTDSLVKKYISLLNQLIITD